MSRESLQLRASAALTVTIVTVASPAAGQQILWQIEANSDDDALAEARVGPDLDGDGVPELFFGFLGELCTATSGGVAKLFSTSGGQLAQWCGSFPSAFGAPIRWLDDIDGGGTPDFAVGDAAYHEPTLGPNTGRICVYSTETELLLYQVVGTQPDGRLGRFDVIADVNADGARDLLVSLYEYGSSGEGETWILSSVDGSILRMHIGSVPWAFLGRFFGAIGDVDGDGVDDYALSVAGGVDVYSGSSGATYRHLAAGKRANFGCSIAKASDLDGDGLADVLISSASTRYTGRGVVDAISPASGNVIWTIDNDPLKDFFGRPVIEVADQNDDGYREYLMCAYEDGHDGKSAGRVDLISGATRRPLFIFYPDTSRARYFGQFMAPGADFNGDGIEDFVIGTPDGGDLSNDAGLFQIRAGNDLWLQADPIAPIDGDTVVVDLRGPPKGQLGLIALVAIDGVETFETLLLATFNPRNEMQFCADVDSSLSGMEFTLMGYAQNKNGRGPLLEASPFVVSVQ